ncbi:MAG: CAP domain-containing protein [Actinomycetes bacterium]
MTARLPFDAQRQLAAALTAIALVLAALVTGAVTARPAGASTVENVFTAKMNQARTSHGLPRYATRSDLVAVARAQAGRMASSSRLYHNPNLTRDVHNWRWVGENVGYGPDATLVHTAFMNSAPHRANILDHDYTEVGVGVVVRGGRVWVAEVFRRPARAVSRSYAGFTHTLRLGSRGAAVQRVQKRLGLRTTGYYGHATERAVTSFQRHQGWSGRGRVGPKTWHRLF